MKCPSTKWALRRPGLIPVFFLLLTFEISGQDYVPGPRSLGIGACYTTLFCPSSSIQNPALLPTQSHAGYYFSHARPYITKELGICSLNVTAPVTNGTFSFALQNYGIKGFQHFSSSLSYALKLDSKFMAGVSFYYANELSNREWNYLWCLGMSAGLYYLINDKTNIGLHLGNPVSVNNYPAYGLPYASILSLGISRIIYDQTVLYSEITYYSDIQYQFKCGLEYVIKNLTLQCGYHSNPQTYTFGTGIHMRNILLHFSYAWSTLPASFPCFQLSFIPEQ